MMEPLKTSSETSSHPPTQKIASEIFTPHVQQQLFQAASQVRSQQVRQQLPVHISMGRSTQIHMPNNSSNSVPAGSPSSAPPVQPRPRVSRRYRVVSHEQASTPSENRGGPRGAPRVDPVSRPEDHATVQKVTELLRQGHNLSDTRPIQKKKWYNPASASVGANAFVQLNHAESTRIQYQYIYEEIMKFLPYARITDAEKMEKELFRRKLESLAQNLASELVADEKFDKDKVVLRCFGSLANGFAMPGADLDLVVVGVPTELKEPFMERLKQAIAETGCEVIKLDRVRVPVLKVASEDPKVDCDINFHNELAVHNTLLLRNYACCDPTVADLGRIVKLWAKARKINDPRNGTLCSYGYILMVLHYLVNVEKVIPNLQLIVHRPQDMQKCEGHDVSFVRSQTWIERDRARFFAQNPLHKPPLLELLIRGFFRYYGDNRAFRWISDCISLRTPGGIKRKVDKDWVKTRTDEKGVRHRYLIAIEDPFELDHNVGRTVPHRGICAIREEFRRAHYIIQNSQYIPMRGWVWHSPEGVPSDYSSKENGHFMTEAEDRGDLHRGNFPRAPKAEKSPAAAEPKQELDAENSQSKQAEEAPPQAVVDGIENQIVPEPKATHIFENKKVKKGIYGAQYIESLNPQQLQQFQVDPKQLEDMMRIQSGGNGCWRGESANGSNVSGDVEPSSDDVQETAGLLQELAFPESSVGGSKIS